jgi:group I intron endonuclease
MRIISGIYHIVNLINKKSYIGSSKNIIRRWYIHKSALKNNRHHCTYLQRSWNKYGKDAFKFEIIAEIPFVSEEQLLAEELKIIKERLPEYNIGAVGGGDNLTNNPNRDDIIRRMTLTLRTQVLEMSNQERKQRWGRPGQTNPNWKGGISVYHCVDCHCEISYGNSRCMLCSKIGSQNPFYGKHHTLQSKQKSSQKMKGRLPSNTNSITINGQLFKSQAEAARQLNVSIGTISNWIRGKVKQPRRTLLLDVNHIQ